MKPNKWVGLSISDDYVEYLEKKLETIKGIVCLTERWCDDQEVLLNDGDVCKSAMKDIRRIVREV